MILIRRSAPLLAGALLAGALLTGCGFGEATNRVNQITAGSTERDATVDVINALVVASADGSGTLHGQLANNDDSDAHRLVEITGDQIEISGLQSLRVPADDAAQLAEAGIRVDGDFAAGEYLAITLTFDDPAAVEDVEVQVPVVPACHEYAGLDTAPPSDAGQGGEQEEYHCEPAEAPDGGH